MQYFPLFAALKDRPVLVIGAGEVAGRKIELLLQAQAKVRVIARTISPDIQVLLASQQLVWWKKDFEADDVNQAVLTIAATDDAELNARVYEAGLRYHRLVNVVDNTELCQFIVPAIVDRSPVQVAISTGGAAPVLARQIRQHLEQELPASLGAKARLAQQFRSLVKTRIATMTARRIFWEELFDLPLFTHYVETQQLDQAKAVLLNHLDQQQEKKHSGHVTLVGAGPGDEGLLTLKGYQALQAADIVLYDALVGAGVLELIRRDAKRIAVGKRAQQHQVSQEVTNQLLVHYAKQGLRVVRLKGGDPYLFGRGAEEVQVLQAEGITYTVVPGVTAALGATAAAGIPLTHRHYAQSVTMVTGHCRADGDEIDWGCLAKERQTIVIYMGTMKAAEISAELIARGKAKNTPVAIISQGSLPEQQVSVGLLHELGDLAQHAIRPALIVIGEVVSLRKNIR